MNARDGSSAAVVIGRVATRVILTALMVLAVFVVSRYAYDFGKAVFYQKPAEEAPGRDIEVELRKDTGYEEAADILLKEGLINDAAAFSMQEKIYRMNLWPGTYTLNTSMTSKELIDTISARASKLKEDDENEKAGDMTEDVTGAGSEGE